MSDAADTGAGSIETQADVGKGNPALARFWTVQLDLSDRDELKWRKRAAKVNRIYADVAAKGDDDAAARIKFNILYSNVQTLAPALLPSVPQPDVRKRFRDKDPVGGLAADMLERCARTLCDQHDFAYIMQMAVLDRCLAGRAIIREDYEVTTEDSAEGQPQRITLQQSVSRQVLWEDFRRGPGKTWQQITWVGFRHQLRREQMVEMFGDKIGNALPLNLEPEEKDRHKDDDPTIWKRGEVWEIHDKDKREIVWICKDYKDGPCKVEEDKNKFVDFFPIPRPLLAIMRPDSQEPVDEFRQYESQAGELDKITKRIDKIIGGLKVRGITAANIAEFKSLSTAGDNEMIVTQSGDGIAAMQAAGGLDKAIWMWPLETAIKALQELYMQREAVKQTIYEIVGISDILRGSVDPKEKLGQSQLKASWGSRRLDTGREEVQRFARDVIRLKVENIAQHFEPQQLMMMSGIKLPTQAEKQQAQAMLLQQQQAAPPMGHNGGPPMNGAMNGTPQPVPPQAPPPPQIPPQIAEMMKLPTIEEVMAVIRSDAMRTFRCDVETDQTVVGDEQAEKEGMVNFLKGTVDYWTGMGPIIQGGFPVKVAVGLYSATARRFKLGRDVEDELGALEDEPPPPPPQQTQQDPAAAAKAQSAQVVTEAKLKTMAADEQRAQQDHARNMELKNQDVAKSKIDFGIAELNAKVKAGEIMAPQAAPEQPSEIETEMAHTDLALKQAQVAKAQREADGAGAEAQQKMDTTEMVGAAHQTVAALGPLLEQIAGVLKGLQDSQQQQNQLGGPIARSTSG